MALTASKTETCTMAIVLTAMGVAGFRDAMSAAFAFASVTTSARAYDATERIAKAKSPIRAFVRKPLIFMVLH